MASEVKANKLSPSSGTALQIGDASDTITIPTGATFTITDGLGVAGGGTGLTSFTAGDVLYATGTTTLAKLAKGTAEQVLAMNSGATAPDWGSVDLTVLPTITVAKGGTNLSSFTAGDILYATGSTTLAKLAKGTGLQGLQTNSGATAPEWTNSPQSLMTAAGDILYASGANTLAKLAKGSDDEVLTLASGVPSWAAAGGGAWNFISSQTASDDDLIEFTTAQTPAAFTSTYDVYKIFLTNVHMASDSVTMQAQFRQSASYITSGYQYANTSTNTGGSVSGNGATSAAFMKLTRQNIGSAAGEIENKELTIWDPLGTDNAKQVTYIGAGLDSGNNLNFDYSAGSYNGNQAAMDGIKFYMSGGNITSGTFAIYGLSKS
jgi:hypothetical protein